MAPFRDELIASGGSVEAIQCDVTSRQAVEALFAHVEHAHGRLDILVNSAGVFQLTPAFDVDLDKIERLFQVNTLGAISMIRAALPIMKRAGSGGIVTIASAAGVQGGATFAGYSASKAAIIHFSKTIVSELGHSGIRVNCVAPGSVRTPMTAFAHDPANEKMKSILAARTARTTSPYGQLLSEPEDIAHIVIFLLSDQARAIQGACIVADQGSSAAAQHLTE